MKAFGNDWAAGLNYSCWDSAGAAARYESSFPT